VVVTFIPPIGGFARLSPWLPSHEFSMRAFYLCLPMLLLTPDACCRAVAHEATAQVVAEATGGWLTSTKGAVFDAACNQTLDYEAEVIDLNKDGQPEVFTMIHGLCLGGAAGVQVNLLIKDADGRWQPQFGFPGLYTLLETGNAGFPDIEIGGPGFCFPVWRWDGAAYALHKTCPR
jgi:hypothetical protein